MPLRPIHPVKCHVAIARKHEVRVGRWMFLPCGHSLQSRLPHVAAAFQPEGVTVTVGFTGGTRGIDATSATPSCGVVCNPNAQIIDYTALVREAGRTPKAHTTVSALPQPNAHARASPNRCCNGY